MLLLITWENSFPRYCVHWHVSCSQWNLEKGGIKFKRKRKLISYSLYTFFLSPYMSVCVLSSSLLFTVPEDVIKQETDSLKVAGHTAPSPAPFSLKRELAVSSTSTSSPARARGRPRKTKPGSMHPRHLKSPFRGQESEQPQAQLQPETQPHPQLQAHAQPQPQPQPQLQSHPQSHNGFLEPEGSPLSLGQSQHDLSQSAFLSWLSQTQSHGSLLSSSVLTPDSSPGKLDPTPSQPLEEPEPDEAESSPDSQAPWFNFSAQIPCNAAPTPPPAVSEDQPTPSLQLPASSKPVSSQNK